MSIISAIASVFKDAIRNLKQIVRVAPEPLFTENFLFLNIFYRKTESF